MNVNVSNRLVVAAGIGAAALLGLSVATYATPRQGQTQKQEQKQQNDRNKQNQARDKQHQQELVNQQQQRLTQYRDYLNQQQRVAKPQSAQLQHDNRRAQYTVQQQYVERLHQQQLTVQRQKPAIYGRDPYFSAPAAYRYSRGDREYETNQYGVNMLKQGVNYGYDQGYRTGEADRMDRAPSNFEGSFAYQDANYGYTASTSIGTTTTSTSGRASAAATKTATTDTRNSACMPTAGARFSTPCWGRSSTSE